MNIQSAIIESTNMLQDKSINSAKLDSEILLASVINKDRKTKIGTGDRSERIRTYNFPQGRITDHRINLTLHRLEEFLEGEAFDEMVESLTLQAQEESLSNLG